MNCLIVDDEEMSRTVVRHFVEQTESLKLVGVCENAVEASKLLHKEKVDVLFLDIEMPDMTGYQLLEVLKEQSPQVVLVTAKKEHAAEAFNYNVADYLVKPLNYPRFLKAITRVQERLNGCEANIKPTKRSHEELFVRSDSKIIKVNFNDILYVEALADYIMIFTQDAKIIVHSTMKGFQSRLPESKFTRIHRSYIVNVDKVEAIENLFVVINKKRLPIGTSYKEDFMKRLNLL